MTLKLNRGLSFVFLLLLLVACGKDDGLNDLKDSIQIISVNPSANLEDGKEYKFIVKVKYELKTFEKAGMSISFNNTQVNSFRAIPHAHAGAEKGDGQHTFDVTLNAKDWKNEGQFKVLVSLYESVAVVDGEEPKDPQLLDDDTKVLSFKD